MSIKFRCEHCHKEIKAPDDAGGRRGTCPYCKQSCYVPTPVSEEDILPLKPIDEEEQRREQEFRRALLEEELDLRAEIGDTDAVPTVPLEHREDISSEDLHHFVVNYCLDLYNGNKERAQTHLAQLKKFGGVGMKAVQDFLSGKVQEPALQEIPSDTLKEYLSLLGDQL